MGVGKVWLQSLTTVVGPRLNGSAFVCVENHAACIGPVLIRPSLYVYQAVASFCELRFLSRRSPFLNEIIPMFSFPSTHLFRKTTARYENEKDDKYEPHQYTPQSVCRSKEHCLQYYL